MMDVDMSESNAAAAGGGTGVPIKEVMVERSSNGSRKASTTISTRSSRRTASPSRASKQDDAGPPTPESPPFRLTRKRAASLADKADRDEQPEDAAAIVVDEGEEAADIPPTIIASTTTIAPTTHSRMSSGGTSVGSAGSAASHVCLCQPDPKIPRPRNAFILYRQHHQAAIVAQHPGLANPEISKIIGEQWKAQPESVRNEWKALAEEEKLRHQQQYPEYRYQPRRGGRRGSLSTLNTSAANGTTADKYHCSKCGGRSITTPPTTTTTPFSSTKLANQGSAAAAGAAASTAANNSNINAAAPSSLNTPMLPPPTPTSALTPTSRYLPPMMSNLAINTQAAAAAAAASSSSSSSSPNYHRPSITTTRTTPTWHHPNYHPRHPRDDPPSAATTGPLSPDAKRRRVAANTQAYVPPAAGARIPGTPYPPPPFSGVVADPRRHSLPRPDSLLRGGGSQHHHHHHHQQQQQHEEAHLTLPPLHHHQHHHAAATAAEGRNIEAMVRGMPFWGKVRVLGKIAPPYGGGGGGERTPRSARGGGGGGVRGAIVAVEGDDDGGVAEGPSSIRGMAAWLEESLNKTDETWARVAEAPRTPAGWEEEEEGEEEGGGKSPAGGASAVGLSDYIRLIGEWHERSRQMVEFITRRPDEERARSQTARGEMETEDAAAAAAAPSARDKRTPVLIMPTYHLRAADLWATRIPICDTYSPADHWQWVATLWRGIVGPDITIYIRDVSQAELDVTGGKMVEVREDGQTKCLIVKRVGGKEIEESALRRLGFEVGELIRSVSATSGT